MGISFFTFQQIAFLVDRYRGDPADYTLLEYACFVSFFPCVTSGPIAFHDEVIPQMRAVQGKGPSAQGIAEGLWLFSLGIWKKVIVAEAFGGGADWGWANLPALNSTTALAVTLSYTLQLYFDFSGYTDMARGIGKMLGVTLPENFDVPYQALTIRGFWKGWHMTMTRFFTRYLYIPLGGSRRGLPRTCVNTLVIFLASGLWHGADWSFVVWGGLHGIAMVADPPAGQPAGPAPPCAVLGADLWVCQFLLDLLPGRAASGRRWPCAGPLRGVRSVRWQKSLPPPFRCRRLPGLDATWR